jgi:hypothetical protein
MKDTPVEDPVLIRAIPFVIAILTGGVIVLLVFGIYKMVNGDWIAHDCYASPMGGAPVEARSISEAPYVCGEFTSGYRCMKMKPCPDD